MPSLPSKTPSQCSDNSTSPFTADQNTLFQLRFEEGYDIDDPEYSAWIKIYHPELSSPPCSEPLTSPSSMSNSTKSDVDLVKEVLVLPRPKPSVQKRKKEQSIVVQYVSRIVRFWMN